MKRFFEPGSTAADGAAENADTCLEPVGGFVDEPAAARIAVYDALTATPRVEEVRADSAAEFIEALSIRAYELAHGQGGGIPYSVIREVVENLIHAHFAEVVVSVLDEGTTIRFSDHGPGIDDKERSFAPGFSTATAPMKNVIRGVGSGLPIVKECLTFSGGFVAVEDNLKDGTVVTLTLRSSDEASHEIEEEGASPEFALSLRHKQVLTLAMELGSIGPSAVSGELGVALSTAYRDLAHLEALGLLESRSAGKRSLSDSGVSFLDALLSS